MRRSFRLSLLRPSSLLLPSFLWSTVCFCLSLYADSGKREAWEQKSVEIRKGREERDNYDQALRIAQAQADAAAKSAESNVFLWMGSLGCIALMGTSLMLDDRLSQYEKRIQKLEDDSARQREAMGRPANV